MCRKLGGVLAAKVSDFGSNLLKCARRRWAPNLLKSATWSLAPSNVLKCVPAEEGSNLLKYVAATPYVLYTLTSNYPPAIRGLGLEG